MLKFVDPGGWWYQQLPNVEVTPMPVREWPPNASISLDQVLSSGNIISFGMLSVCSCREDCPFYKLWHVPAPQLH